MKTLFLTILTTIFLASGGKDYRVLTVTTEPQMHCSSCENKIKKNLRFEKGVVKITTDINNQMVIVTYDPTKTTPDSIAKGFEKIGYKTKILSDEPAKKNSKELKRAEGHSSVE